MSKPSGDLEHTESLGEEIANSASHGAGLLGALTALPFLLASAAHRGSRVIVGVSVFGATIVMLYLASTLYHAFPRGKTKLVFRILDHSAIFLLIAGTYTPFTLGVLRGAWGWSLLAVVWVLAICGITLTVLGGVKHPVLSTCLYIGMGWLVLVAVRPLSVRMPVAGLAWLAAGGVAYTIGAAFFALRRLRYAHFVFHLFVIAGTTCHFVAVWRYAT